MNGLVFGERIELLNARFDVVLGHPLALGDRREIHIARPRLVIGDGPIGDIESGCGLSPHHRDPQSPFRDDLGFGCPDSPHGRGRIALGEHIWHAHTLILPRCR